MIDQLTKARQRAVPIIAIETPDQVACARSIISAFAEVPVLTWDSITGAQAATPAAQGHKVERSLGNPIEVLSTAHLTPANGILLMMGAHPYTKDPMTAQAILNLREIFKGDGRTLILLGPTMTFESAIGPDIYRLDDPLPDRDKLGSVLVDIAQSAGQELDAANLSSEIDALAGLSSFAAEQAAALAVSSNGYDLHQLQARKRQMIRATDGLECYDGQEKLTDVIGYSNVTSFLQQLTSSPRNQLKAILWFDELEKAIGTTQDTSGVSQALLGILLTWTQEQRALGLMLAGVPGSGKSLTAKATAGSANIPCLRLDMAGLKGSLVGESEQRLKSALKTAAAISQGQLLMIATLNDTDERVPSELRARFRLGTFFFDTPTPTERDRLWLNYRTKWGIGLQDEDPPCSHWVGREIDACCELAYRLDCSLKEAAAYITPVATSDAERIARMREYAAGRYNSASYPGSYAMETATERALHQPAQQSRRLSID